MGKKSVRERTGSSAIKTVADLIQSGKAKNIVVLTGAGISTSAGIPDFRSPETGLYHNLQRLNLPFPEAVFELGYFKDNPKPFWTLAKELYPGKHFPTPTHYFLKLLNEYAVLKRIFTQNIDTLEHQTGLDPNFIIEAHGSFASAHCLTCRKETSTEYVLKAGVRHGEVVRCAEKGCGGLVKPDIVFFGEGLPDKFFERMSDLTKCDLLIVIGTSLQVQPFAQLPSRTPSSCPRILINREAVGPFSNLDDEDEEEDYMRRILGGGGGRKTDLFWKGDADEGARLLVKELGWEERFQKLIEDGRSELERKWKMMEKLGGQADEDKGAEEEKEHQEEEEAEGQTQAEVRAKKAAEEIDKVVKNQQEEIAHNEDDLEKLATAIEKDLNLGQR